MGEFGIPEAPSNCLHHPRGPTIWRARSGCVFQAQKVLFITVLLVKQWLKNSKKRTLIFANNGLSSLGEIVMYQKFKVWLKKEKKRIEKHLVY
jgi:hypothetical protein